MSVFDHGDMDALSCVIRSLSRKHHVTGMVGMMITFSEGEEYGDAVVFHKGKLDPDSVTKTLLSSSMRLVSQIMGDAGKGVTQ